MGDDDKTVGQIIGKLDALAADVRDIKDGKSAMCQVHERRLSSIEAKLDAAAAHTSDTEASLFGGFFKFKGIDGANLGRMTAIIMLAYIILKMNGIVMPWESLSSTPRTADTVTHESAIP